MDADRFDTISRSLTDPRTRRGALAALLGGVLGLLERRASGAKKKGKGKGKKKKKRSSPVSPPLPTGPALAYECPAPSESVIPVDETIRLVQSFIPTRSGPLRQIQFLVDKEAVSAGNYIVQLVASRTDQAGVPSHLPEDVRSQVIVADDAVAAGEGVAVIANFNGPALVQGVEYFAALSRPGPSAFFNVHVRNIGTGEGCAGFNYQSANGNAFSRYARDMIVSIFITA